MAVSVLHSVPCPVSSADHASPREGNQHVRAAADRKQTVEHVTALARKAHDLLKVCVVGHSVDQSLAAPHSLTPQQANNCLPEGEFLISGGGTGSFLYEAGTGLYNEIQPVRPLPE